MNEEKKPTPGENRITVHAGEMIPTYSEDGHSMTIEEKKAYFKNLREEFEKLKAEMAEGGKTEEAPRHSK